MNMRIKPLSQALAIAVSGGMLSTSAAIAQSSSFALEEVIVTTTKRSESLQDVPVSVGVVTGEFMRAFDIGDITDIQNFVPGLQVQETFGSTAVRIRGLGSGITNLAFDSSVPLYIDDVYSGRGNAMLAATMDMERLEVARGPQGALFGKSTIAGAISTHTARPTEELEAEIRVGTELEDGGFTASGYVSGPLSDSVRGRLAVLATDLDGYTDNLATGSDNDGAEEQQAVRLSLDFDASDTTSFFAKFETGTKDIDGRNNQLVRPGAMSTQTTDPNAEYEADDVRSVSTGFGREDFSEVEWTLATLSMESEVAGHSIKLIASQWDYETTHFLDVDGHPEDILTTFINDDYESTSFEFRFLSPSDQTIEYIAGIWYQDSELSTQQFSKFANPFFNAVIPDVVPVKPQLLAAVGEGTGQNRSMSRDADAFSIYGQVVFNVNERLRAIFDLRYTEEDQDSVGQSVNLTWNGVTDQFQPITVPVYATGAAFLPGHQANYLFFQNRKDDSLDPSVRVQYDISDNAMAYLVYAEGSKAGGMKANDGSLGTQLEARFADTEFLQRFVGMPTLTREQMAAGITLNEGNGIFDFEDEEAESWELGFKTTLLDGALTLNGAIFTTEFKNLQTSNYDGTRFIIGNAGQATVDGAELELNWQATDNLRLNASASYIDAAYDEFLGAQCVENADGSFRNADCDAETGTENQAGEPLERSPDLEYNLSALWESPVSDSMVLKAAASLYYSGEYFVQPTQAAYSTQDSYTKVDLRVALASADDRWEVAVNGRNLSDEMVISHAYNIAGSQFNNLTRGRTVTLEGLLRF